MKYFIDFEATQFTNEIISIGCIREDGVSFSSLVKPTHKVTKFITKLTGITNEMLDEAPEIAEVMREFDKIFDINPISDIFYSYGNGDKDFIDGTMHYNETTPGLSSLEFIKYCLKDYSLDVKSFFGLSRNVPMKKVAEFIKNEDIVQRHDALEDAMMLSEIYAGLQVIEKPDECPFPMPDPTVPSAKEKSFNRPRNYKATSCNGSVQYFVSVSDTLRKFKLGPDATEKTKTRVMNRVLAAIENGTLYANCMWEKL